MVLQISMGKPWAEYQDKKNGLTITFNPILLRKIQRESCRKGSKLINLTKVKCLQTRVKSKYGVCPSRTCRILDRVQKIRFALWKVKMGIRVAWRPKQGKPKLLLGNLWVS